jgi:hypothetical protein
VRGEVERSEGEGRHPCRWVEIFDTFLAKMLAKTDELGDLLSEKFFRLDRYNTSNMRIGGQLGHPVLGYFSRLWGELERTDLAYRDAFTAPNGYRRQIEEIAEIFTAPVTVFKFIFEDANYVVVAGDMQRTSLAALSDQITEKDIGAIFVDMTTMFSVVRRFGNVMMDPEFRLCHHEDCPMYRANFCNMWLFIPEKYENCTFKKRVEYIRTYARPRGLESSVEIKFGNRTYP